MLQFDSTTIICNSVYLSLLTDQGTVASAEGEFRSTLCRIITLNLAIDCVHVRLNENISTSVLIIIACGAYRSRSIRCGTVQNWKEDISSIRKLELVLILGKCRPSLENANLGTTCQINILLRVHLVVLWTFNQSLIIQVNSTVL